MTTSKSTDSVAKAKTPRLTSKLIRNLNNAPVHLRIHSAGNERPYFMQLAPRGFPNDVHEVPAHLTITNDFIQGAGRLFEIITRTEANKIEYPKQGYLAQTGFNVEVIRADQNIVARIPDWDGKGRLPDPQQIAQKADELARANADSMIPESVDLTSRAVTIQRVKG